jgi:transposase, IS5 family
MTKKKIGQKGFVDIILEGKAKEGILDEISKLLDFGPLANAIDKCMKEQSSGSSKAGRPPYPTLAMLKVIFLQAMYSLSDEQMQFSLADRLSFRKFAGFSLTDDTPDNATICRFRGICADLDVDLLKMVNEQLDLQGIRLRQGTLVDASIIHSSAKRPSGGEVSERDPQAGWTKKGGKYHYGYKSHISMDKESSLVNRMKVTSADVHDSQATYEVLDQDDQETYLDKAYDDDSIRRNCRTSGIKARIMHRTYASDSPGMKARKAKLNTAYSRVRCGVEKFFGTLKRSYGLARTKYIGIAKNQLLMDLVASSYNVKRTINILAEQKKAALRPA